MSYMIEKLFSYQTMRKECCFALLIFLVILAISTVICSRTTNSAYAQTVSLPSSSQEVTPFKKWYDEQKEKQQPSNTVSVKITSPAKGQKVPVGELKVLGTSTDNATTDCQVYVDVNDIKPMQNTTAVGPAVQNDYSNWNFTYTNKYHLISEGVNELTAKLSCINNPANITKYYSVNVTGVATSSAAANNTTTVPTSNATTRNETQQRTTMTTMENNETQVSADTANQTQQQTPQVKPKPALQAEHSTSSVQQPLNQTQNQEEEEEEQEQKQPMTDSQKEGSFTSEEFVPLDKSSTGSDIIAEEPKGTTDEDEEKLAELIESVTSDDAYDEEQIEQEKPLEDELLPLERQEVPLETIERQPLEQKQPLETLEDQQPIEEQPVQTFNKEEQPSQSGIQPLEQQPLEEQQPLQTFNRQQLSPTQQQPLEQQLITEQQVPESPAGKQQQEEKRSINQVQEHHDNGHNMPFVLPFDSQDVISAN